MYEEVEGTRWYLDSGLHYTYLLSCIAFLLGMLMFGEVSLMVHLLLIVHCGLLLGKLFCNNFLMGVIFGANSRNRRFYPERNWDRTMAFKRDQPMANSNMTMLRSSRDPKVEEVMFGNGRFREKSPPPRNFAGRSSSYQSQASRWDNRGGVLDNYLYKTSTAGRGFEDRGQEPYKRSTYNARDSTFNNRGSNINNNPIHLRYNNERHPSPNVSPNRPSKESFYRSSQYDSRPLYQPMRGNTPHNYPVETNYNPIYKEELELITRSSNVRVAEKEFTKHSIKKQRAIKMIVYLKRYFDSQIVIYKDQEALKIQAIKRLTSDIFGPNFSRDIPTLLSRARAAINELALRKEIPGSYFERPVQEFDRAGFSKNTQELKQVLESLYYDYIPDFNSPLQRLKFYKNTTLKEILPNDNIQLVEAPYFSNIQGEDGETRMHRIGLSKDTGFSCACTEQTNHVLNMEETFLIVILRGLKHNPSCKVTLDLMAIP